MSNDQDTTAPGEAVADDTDRLVHSMLADVTRERDAALRWAASKG